jgi:hypothetical protein
MKKADAPLASYLTRDELLALLDAPDRSTTSGMRDRAMLHLAFAAALRVSELVQRFHETSRLCGIPISAQHVVGCWSNNPWLDTHGSTSTRNRYLDWRRRPGAVGEHRSVSNGTSELG